VARTAIRIAAAVGATGLAAGIGFSPAFAHGAPVKPISRTVACAPDNPDARSAACKAAVKANGGPIGPFDNLRVAGVNGRDKSVIPDGKLCSGGLAAYRGLDLARDDWPSTRMAAGSTLTMTYRGTIPHEGVFRIYLTKQGYDPDEPLGWDDLSSAPIITVTDPPLRAGSYRISGKLPRDRTGRHLLFTVWQTTSTPDTYYSCSDVVFPAAAPAAPAPSKSAGRKAGGARASTPAAAAPSGDTIGGPRTTVVRPVASNAETTRREVLTTVVVLILGAAIFAAVLLISRARREQPNQRLPRNR
jgi:chitin-binding protein